MILTYVHCSIKNFDEHDVVDGMFRWGEAVMSLPIPEKMKYEQGDSGETFGFVSPLSRSV